MSLQTLSFLSARFPKEVVLKRKLEQLPEAITAPRTDAVYNCHSYLTKVPVAAIKPFVETFSKPGDTIADIFAGSGMTGLAAAMTGRGAVLSDISVLGQHIAAGYLAEVSPSTLREEAAHAMRTARKQLGDLYTTRRMSDGAKVELVRTVWSFTYACPACEQEMVYFDHLSPTGSPPKTCSSCSRPFARRHWPRGKDVPVEAVVCGENGRHITQGVSPEDRRKMAKAQRDKRAKDVPSLRIEQHREMYSRSGLGKAEMTETSRFFSPRNAIALFELWEAINTTTDENLRQKLRFAFTAILPRASKRYQWSAQRPLNAQNQTYYIAPVYYEWNVFELFQRKVEAAIRADEVMFGGGDAPLFKNAKKRQVRYELASADRLSHLKNRSVDYVFTDPPFGSNIFYSDMSLFHEAWLGRVTDNECEAVVHTTGKKKKGSAERYEALLKGAFSEAFRVLKPGRHMSLVFGNSSGRIWGLVQRALRDAGFKAAPVHVAILDKGQRSVKGLNSGSEGVVTLDLILTVQKPGARESADDARALKRGDSVKLIREAIAELSIAKARNPSYVYAQVLTKAMQKHIVLDDLHLGDVLVALRNAGYAIERKSGLLLKADLEDHSKAA